MSNYYLDIVTKRCPNCGHTVHDLRRYQNFQCWCGEWLYPICVKVGNNWMAMDAI